MTQLKTAGLSLAVLGLCFYLISLGAVDYVCRPYKPQHKCKDRERYEVWIFSHENRKYPIGVIETPCIIDSGDRYTVNDAWFESPMSPPQFFEEPHDLPKTHTEVCKVD